MAGDYASIEDLKKHWSKLPAEDEGEAAQKLHEASVEIRGNYPDLDHRIAIPVLDGGMDPEIPKLIACRMVKRAMDAPDERLAGVEQVQQNAGPFGQTLRFTNPDGNIYLSKADRNLLKASRPRGKAFTIHPGAAYVPTS